MKFNIHRPPLVLTFDDGTITQYKTIKSLVRLGYKATLFVATGKNGSFIRNKYHEKSLTEPDQVSKIKELSELGVEIGSHTVNHLPLTTFNKREIELEVASSKDYLAKIIGEEVVSFAYPYGMYNDEVLEVVRRYYSYGRAAHILPKDQIIPYPNIFDDYTISATPPYARVYPCPIIFLFHNESLTKILAVVTKYRLLGYMPKTFSEAVDYMKNTPLQNMEVEMSFKKSFSTETVAFAGRFLGRGKFIIEGAGQDGFTLDYGAKSIQTTLGEKCVGQISLTKRQKLTKTFSFEANKGLRLIVKPNKDRMIVFFKGIAEL